MFAFQLRPSSRMLNQIARIERLCGQWDRLSESSVLASEELETSSIVRATESILALDSTTPPNGEGSARALLHAHDEPIHVDLAGIEQVYDILCHPNYTPTVTRQPVNADVHHKLRTTNINFTAPSAEILSDEIVFGAVPGFLVEKRLSELLSWLDGELESRVNHPLVTIGSFHLTFLQISPFPTANHRIALVLMWKLLCEEGYHFIRHNHIAPFFARRMKSYFYALKQAEKTAGSSWSSLNVWLEFFFENLSLAVEELIAKAMHQTEEHQLTTVQRRILELVRSTGPVTRDSIARQTGINVSTIKYNLSVLSERGHLQRHGGGRSTNYTLN